MTNLFFDIDGTTISLRDECSVDSSLTEGNSDYECQFSFSPEWRKLVKYVFFHNKSSNIMKPIILNEQNKCLIPVDVLSYGDLLIKVIGTEHNEFVKSTDNCRLSIYRSISGEVEIPEPSQKMYDKLVNLINDIDNRSIENVYIDNTLNLIIRQKNGNEISCGKLDTSSVTYSMDYETLENLPKINDVTVIGNKTSADYNLGYSGGGSGDDSDEEMTYDDLKNIWDAYLEYYG